VARRWIGNDSRGATWWARQVKYAEERAPHPKAGSEAEIAALRSTYVKEALRVGSVPLPATGKGITKTVAGKFKGRCCRWK
jgi:hypothetical protein